MGGRPRELRVLARWQPVLGELLALRSKYQRPRRTASGQRPYVSEEKPAVSVLLQGLCRVYL